MSVELIFVLWFAMLCRAQCEEMLYYVESTRLWRLFRRSPILGRWYKGHVSLLEVAWRNCPSWLRYNPSLPLPFSPFTDDFWHFVKKLEFASYGVAFGLVLGSWWYGIELYLLLGIFFAINFHTIIPSRWNGSWRPLRWVLAFWRPRN
jgi:hypothetical protein